MKTFKEIMEKKQYKIAPQGKGEGKSYRLMTTSGDELIDMEFDSPVEAKKYAKKKGLSLTEALSGKRNFGFEGKDEIGNFWVVMNATSGNEVLEDLLFEADIFDMMLQQRGGLEIPAIQGIYKSKSKAKKIAEKIAEQAFRDLVNTTNK